MSAGPIWSRKMNGPTIRRSVWGRTRPTKNPPRSCVCGVSRRSTVGMALAFLGLTDSTYNRDVRQTTQQSMQVLKMDPVFSRPSRSMRSGAIRSVRELQERGLIGDGDVGAIQQVVNEFSLAITAEMAELIEPNQVSGPIAKQFVPSESELIESESDLADPIGDDRHSPAKGILHP